MESEPAPRTIINKKRVHYFSGTGYFGFQVHPEVIQAACLAAQQYGISSATSAAGYGTNPVLINLENKISEYFGTNGVLHYASGCLGNFIIIEGLKNDYDIVFVDKESHYSIKNATTLMDKPMIEFAHRDAGDLKKQLNTHLKAKQRPLILCDGIFPITGELSPLPDYVKVIEDIDNATICVDDAHAIGVIGDKGFGSFEYFGLEGDNWHASGVLSKALGGHGGLIVGEDEFVAKLKKNSALANACSVTPIPAAAATAKALEILHRRPSMRKKLWKNARYAKMKLKELGFDVDDSPVPIICLTTLNRQTSRIDCESFQKRLFDKDIAVTYVPGGAYSSVPETGAIRISIFSTHHKYQIDKLVREIKKLI
jgi:glycine C-acetyltransferase/8-amino-7-oxononanoate synthase